MEVNKNAVSYDTDSETVVSVLKSGDYIVCEELPDTSLETPDYLTEEELNALMLFGASLVTSVSQNGIVQEYNQTHTCGELLTYYGWNYSTTESLGQRWERSDTSGKIGAVVYPNNQVAIESAGYSYPLFSDVILLCDAFRAFHT